MKKKTMSTDKPVGKLTRVKDFLPPPSELVARDDTVKVTLALSKESVKFFKDKAKENSVPRSEEHTLNSSHTDISRMPSSA